MQSGLSGQHIIPPLLQPFRQSFGQKKIRIKRRKKWELENNDRYYGDKINYTYSSIPKMESINPRNYLKSLGMGT